MNLHSDEDVLARRAPVRVLSITFV
jgi:hypothetical protein